MALILNIDTSIETADVFLAKDGILLMSESNSEPKNHGSFLQFAIQKILSETNTPLKALDAIAVTNGPGSYTGLRVGMASAKGLCFSLNKPIITISTLEVLASSIKSQFILNNDYLFCPLIDARRMEVFTALYNFNIEPILPPQSMILDENSFANQLESKVIVFAGNGSAKLKEKLNHPNALFVSLEPTAKIASMITISEGKYLIKNFDNLAYSEPFYIKDVFFAEKSK